MKDMHSRWRRGIVTGAIVLGSTAGVVGVAVAAAPHSTTQTGQTTQTTARHGHGENDFGMTRALFAGKALSFTYSHGYFCDTSVSSKATTKCEVGAAWKKAPSKQHDPLYITVPLGFSPSKMLECPNGLTCVDHPMTVDMTRLEPALKPLYPQLTDGQLTAALRNFMTPGHDHFITDANHGKPEWWDVRVVGVTSPSVYADIRHHQSFAYIQKLLKEGNKNVLGPIPSNIFLYFSVGAS